MCVEVNSEINFSHRFFLMKMKMFTLFFMLTFLSTTVQFRNDCLELDKCDCYDLQIICQNMWDEPVIIISEPDRIMQFFVLNYYLPGLDFLDQFKNLQLFRITADVNINCTLVNEKRSGASYVIEAPGCSGKL